MPCFWMCLDTLKQEGGYLRSSTLKLGLIVPIRLDWSSHMGGALQGSQTSLHLAFSFFHLVHVAPGWGCLGLLPLGSREAKLILVPFEAEKTVLSSLLMEEVSYAMVISHHSYLVNYIFIFEKIIIKILFQKLCRYRWISGEMERHITHETTTLVKSC